MRAHPTRRMRDRVEGISLKATRGGGGIPDAGADSRIPLVAFAVAKNLIGKRFQKVGRDRSHKIELTAQCSNSVRPPGVSVDGSESKGPRLGNMPMNVLIDMARRSVDVSAMADHRCQVRAQRIGQVVNLLCAEFGVHEKRLFQPRNRLLDRCPIGNGFGVQSIERVELGSVVADLSGQAQHLVQEQPSHNPRLSLPKRNRVPMLVRRDAGRLARSAPCQESHQKRKEPYRRGCNRSPAGPKDSAFAWHLQAAIKAQRHPHPPQSLLEAILP